MHRFVVRLPILLVVCLGLVVAGCADDGELGGPAVGGTVAMQVGSWELTNADLEAEVELWASNPVFLSQVVGIADVGVAGRRSSELVTYVLSHRVLSEIGRQLGAAAGFEAAEQEVASIIDQVDQAFQDPNTGGPLFGAYDDSFREQIGRDFVYQDNLLNPLGAIDLDSADVPEVAVNPKYGTFRVIDRGLGQIVPPEGPLPPPSGSIIGL